MRHWKACSLTFLVLVVSAAPALAQQAPVRVRFDRMQVGFRGNNLEQTVGVFKSGLWAPIFVHLKEDEKGNILLPVDKDGTIRGVLTIETPDMDGVPATYPQPFELVPGQPMRILGYVKAGSTFPTFRLMLHVGDPVKHIELREDDRLQHHAIDVGQHLYLALGGRAPKLLEVFQEKVEQEQNQGLGFRHLAEETDLAKLPELWFGYDGVDLLILSTDQKKFVEGLTAKNRPERLQAIAEWVKRGGRLVVSITPGNQEWVHRLLTSPVFDPPLPDVLDNNVQITLPAVAALDAWARVGDKKAFPASVANPVRVAKLHRLDQVEVEVKEGNTPLIVRMPYGLGSVTLLAFDVENAPFSKWEGGREFWRVALDQFAPRHFMRDFNPGGMGFNDNGGLDVTTRLQRELDRFDSPTISFAWVALFIFLYIIVVGPIDFILLKFVFKRMELTWITFPTVVIGISIIAYFTAYAIKGQDLKINKMDLVDIDLRTDLNDKLETRRAYAYGTTWFGMLSPRIQNYTVGMTPALTAWGAGPDDRPSVPSLVSWLGRPEREGFGGFGRQRSEGLLHRGYNYAPEATGLKDVAIPVWTTKSFTATWSTPLTTLPLQARLEYDNQADEMLLSGTLINKLPMDLKNVWLFYGNKAFLLQDLNAGAEQKITLEGRKANDLIAWLPGAGGGVGLGNPRFDIEGRMDGPYCASEVAMELLFTEKLDLRGQVRNHSQRRIDLSWRISRDYRNRELVVREAVIVAQLPHQSGNAQSVAMMDSSPSRLWLGELPGKRTTPPDLSGQMRQDSLVRFIVPVTPARKR